MLAQQPEGSERQTPKLRLTGRLATVPGDVPSDRILGWDLVPARLLDVVLDQASGSSRGSGAFGRHIAGWRGTPGLWVAFAPAGDDPSDRGPSVGSLSGELVVGAAPDANVRGVIGASHAAGHDVIVLEPSAAFAADPIGAAPCAA